jgi:hypothetical protein
MEEVKPRTLMDINTDYTRVSFERGDKLFKIDIMKRKIKSLEEECAACLAKQDALDQEAILLSQAKKEVPVEEAEAPITAPEPA